MTKKTFLSSLFDFSFSDFIATKVVGIIYGLSILGIILFILATIVVGFGNSFAAGIGALIISPIIALLYLLFVRVGLESLIAGIRTAENTTEIREFVRQIRNEKT